MALKEILPENDKEVKALSHLTTRLCVVSDRFLEFLFI